MSRDLILDHLQQLYVGTEATFLAGPATYPLPADALDHISIDTAVPKKRVIPNADQTGNRGARAAIRGAYDPMSVRILAYLKGSGTATTAPDLAPLFKAAGFTETVGGSDVTYSRTLTPTTSAWVWAVTKDGSCGKMYAGMVEGEISIADMGVDAARIDFAGTAAASSVIYPAGLSGAVNTTATTLPLDPNHGWVIGGAPAFITVTEGALVEVMKVTALSGDSATVVRNVDSGGADSFTAAATITAYVPPTRTVASTTPIGETEGSFTISAANKEIVKASLSIRTGLDLLDKEAFAETRQGMVPMRYGEEGARLTCDVVYTNGSEGISYLHGAQVAATSFALIATIGSTAGNRVVVTMPTAQVADINAPDGADGPRKGTVIFNAYSTDGADLTIKFN